MQTRKQDVKREAGGLWAKGVSPNPTGRPKAVHDFTMLARSHSLEALNKVIQIMNGSTDERSILKAAEIILDRAYGKCTTDVQMLKDEADIPEDIKRMTPEQLIKELKELQ